MIQTTDQPRPAPVNCPVLGMSVEQHSSEHEELRLTALATQEAAARIEEGMGRIERRQDEMGGRLGNIEHALGNGFTVNVDKGKAKFIGSVNLRDLKLTKHWKLLLVIAAVFLGGRLSPELLDAIGQIIPRASGG